MYYVITDSGVITGPKLEAMNKRNNIKLQDLDFKKVGPDFVCTVTKENLEFLQDAKRLNDIGLASLFKKDNTTKLLLIIILVISFINLIKG
jgi:hypothetical protein